MALDTLKITLIFKFDANGWEETIYYGPVTVSSGTVQNYLYNGYVRPIMRARAGLLGRGCRIQGFRCEGYDPPLNKTVQLTSGEAQNKDGSPFLLNPVCNDPWLGWLCHAEGIDGDGNRFQWRVILRGMPGDWTIKGLPGDPDVVPTLMETRLTAYRKVLLDAAFSAFPASSQAYSYKKIVKSGANAPRTVVDVNTEATGVPYFNLTLEDVGLFAKGEKLHIHNVTGCGLAGINGNTQIIDVNGAIYTVKKFQRCPSAIDYDGRGTVYRPDVYQTVKLAFFEPERIVKHDSGRAFFVTRGRGRKRVC